MTKIYTKTGDRGETALLGGVRVKKNCLEIDAIGDVDELNTVIGVAVAGLVGMPEAYNKLELVQHKLFNVGSNIADVQMQLGHVPKIEQKDIEDLELWIDSMESELEPLQQFILPGGHVVAGQLYFARAICRRAERRVVELAEQYPNLDSKIKQYLNRLSDVLFVLGRWVNKEKSVGDVEWKK